MSILHDLSICVELRAAWTDSLAGTDQAHEEGGFILQEPDGTLVVERWPRGDQSEIVVPDHSGGRRGGRVIRATFHTHPNPAPTFEQEPSLTDIRAVRNDPDLRHSEYEGEYVIASATLYRIHPDGTVKELGETQTLLQIS